MFGVSRTKKINKFQMFIIFFCFQSLLDEIKRSFWWSDLDLSNIKQERKYFWSISESFPTRVFKWIMTNPWINENQIEMLFIHLTYHSLRIQKIFAVWYEDRAFQILKFSMSQEVKKKGLLQLRLCRAQKILF